MVELSNLCKQLKYLRKRAYGKNSKANDWLDLAEQELDGCLFCMTQPEGGGN